MADSLRIPTEWLMRIADTIEHDDQKTNWVFTSKDGHILKVQRRHFLSFDVVDFVYEDEEHI